MMLYRYILLCGHSLFLNIEAIFLKPSCTIYQSNLTARTANVMKYISSEIGPLVQKHIFLLQLL